MMDFADLIAEIKLNPLLSRWLDTLEQDINLGLCPKRYGDLPGWLDALARLPALPAGNIELNHRVEVASHPTTSAAAITQARSALEQLIPWRKGPYHLHGIHLDTEWRSDWKWDRLIDAIAPLTNRLVLDVGCGNGYHCWRMLGAGARRVIGIDPSPRFVVQFQMIKKLLGQQHPVDVLPLGIEALPGNLRAFDTTFSMGVFYHRRSPMDHLRELKDTLRSGGQLVLETLVIDGPAGQVLVPPGRYAMMNNVWFLPSPDTLAGWLEKCGFTQVRLVDLCPTTTEEQRATEWMRYHSLVNFLDPQDPTRTVEGHPAPVRAVFVAEVP